MLSANLLSARRGLMLPDVGIAPDWGRASGPFCLSIVSSHLLGFSQHSAVGWSGESRDGARGRVR